MDNIFEDLIILTYEEPLPCSDIIIRINGRKLNMLRMLDNGNNDFTYNTNNINIKSLLNYIISIIDRAHRMRITTAEDIIIHKVSDIISNKEPVYESELKKLNADILELRELMNEP
jgi:hypothetical protein